MKAYNKKRKPKHNGEKGHKKFSVIYYFVRGTYVIHHYKFNVSVKRIRFRKGIKLD